jgi:hypothetical protein
MRTARPSPPVGAEAIRVNGPLKLPPRPFNGRVEEVSGVEQNPIPRMA